MLQDICPRHGSSLNKKSVFIGHGYLTHGGAGSEDQETEVRSTRYHI